MPPHVAALGPGDVLPGAAHHEHMLDVAGLLDRLVHGGFSADGLPRRQPPSAVMTTRASASWIRVASASAEKPPKTTECAAPIRAQASIAIAVSGIIGM
ncbi:hypothetical protein GCM10020256_33610 [Streptomyces thermocoprophilus]